MKSVLRWTLAIGVLAVMLGVAHVVPLPVPPYLDFQVIYHAGLGLLRGIPLYDHAGQVRMIAELAGVSPAQVFVLPFPYPPWYALPGTLLARLPIDVAARLWLELNLAMLMLSIWLLSDGWESIKRLGAFPAALFFLPVLGGLYVGQYSFPVLLGLALGVYALRKERPFWLACALALMTFKPHLGLPAVAILSIYLWARRSEGFPRRALGWTGLIGLSLFAIGYLADPAWPVNYFRSLAGYGGNAGVLSCELCASLSVAVVRWVGATGLQNSLWAAGVLAAAGLGSLTWKWRALSSPPERLLSALVSLTLLASPYLLNYDYLLLLVPMAFLARVARTWRDWTWIILAFCLPWLGIGLYGRAGNNALVLTAVLLAVALWLAPAGREDGTKPEDDS